MVEAKVNGAVVGVSTTKSGKYGINPDLLMLSKADGEWAGESAKFYVAGFRGSNQQIGHRYGFRHYGCRYSHHARECYYGRRAHRKHQRIRFH